MPCKKETTKERNKRFREMKINYAFLKSCPICGRFYDEYWKIFSHIRKSKDALHKNLLSNHVSKAVSIYIQHEGSVFDFFEKLYKERNILAAISNGYVLNLIKGELKINDMEKFRRKKISNTMSHKEHSVEHNRNVSKSLKKAWRDGVFDTKMYKDAYLAGRKNMPSMKGKNNPMYGRVCPAGAGRGRGGIRTDLNQYFRSTWEANFARILKFCNIDYEYEKKRFSLSFDLTYSPDFYCKYRDIYYEIKGHAKSRIKWECSCKNCEKGKIAIKELRSRGIRIKLIGHREYRYLKDRFRIHLEKWEK